MLLTNQKTINYENLLHKKFNICDISLFASANVVMLLKNNLLNFNFNTQSSKIK